MRIKSIIYVFFSLCLKLKRHEINEIIKKLFINRNRVVWSFVFLVLSSLMGIGCCGAIDWTKINNRNFEFYNSTWNVKSHCDTACFFFLYTDRIRRDLVTSHQTVNCTLSTWKGFIYKLLPDSQLFCWWSKGMGGEVNT